MHATEPAINYYPFNVGDYAAHTAHLEPMEDLAYRRLLDAYYLREEPLPADIQVTAKLIRMRSMAADVESVLREFFTLTDDGWRHTRCDAEIEKMRDKQAKARASAAASVNARLQRNQALVERSLPQAQANAERSLPTEPTNVELPTPTPTPKKEEGARKRAPGFDAKAIELPAWLPQDLWGEWVDDRKARNKAISERGAAQQLRLLAEYRQAGHAPERVIRHAIASGNQGLYPPPKLRGSDGAVVGTVQNDEAERTRQYLAAREMTQEERLASEEARKRVMASVTVLGRRGTA